VPTLKRHCAAVMPEGRSCRARPMTDGAYCFMHDPEHAADAAEARRLGGIRRRREGTISTLYEFAGFESAEGIRRLLEIVAADALALDNGIARLRVLTGAASAATRLLGVADFERRLQALESVAWAATDRLSDDGGPVSAKAP
jgi:hypothetical protein